MRRILIALLFLIPVATSARVNVRTNARALVQADDAGQFAIRTAPVWADRMSVDTHTDQREVRSGIYGLLSDHQVRVTGANVDEYFHNVRKVLTPAAVQNASELSIDFDPSYQRLVLHDVTLVRGTERIGQLEASEVRVIEKEPESNDKIFDGQLTALIFLKDVRPGDVIDYSYSLEGSNPLLGGKYADEFDFGVSAPTRLVRHRLVWPAGRPLHFRPARPAALVGKGSTNVSARNTFSAAQAPGIERRGEEEIYTWERHDVDVVAVEDATPDWYDSSETVQVTEYGSWSEVAHWADDLFQPDAASRAHVAALARRIRDEHRTHDEQLIAAIRFVQDDIRYLGIEMGRGSHEPRQPSLTLSQRYGDCKDKAFLLALLLRELGVEAYPALVNTKLRHRLDEFLPSPFLFDHVITQVSTGGRTHWVDGTLSDQGGMLATIDTPNDERAIVVRPETKGLTRIVTGSSESIVIEEAIDCGADPVRSGSRVCTLDVTSTYRGRNADDLRSKLATESLADVAKDHINRYAADHPRIAAMGRPSISDDRTGNVVVMRERYAIRDLWGPGSWTYYPRAIEQRLTRPETLVRSMPLAIEYPLDVTERLIVRGGARPRVKNDVTITETPALRFERHLVRRGGNHGRDLVVTYNLRTRKDSVAVRDVADHLALVNGITDNLGLSFDAPATGVTPLVWGIALVGIFVGVATSLAVGKRYGARQVAVQPQQASISEVEEVDERRQA